MKLNKLSPNKDKTKLNFPFKINTNRLSIKLDKFKLVKTCKIFGNIPG